MDNMNWNYPTPIWFGLNRVKEIQKACENLNIHITTQFYDYIT